MVRIAAPHLQGRARLREDQDDIAAARVAPVDEAEDKIAQRRRRRDKAQNVGVTGHKADLFNPSRLK
jgi:hypothetical protein